MQVERIWFLKVKGKNLYVHYDSRDAGYPSHGSFWQATKFNSLEKALTYRGSDDYEICSTDEVPMQHCTVPDPYEVELAKLKEKYNRT